MPLQWAVRQVFITTIITIYKVNKIKTVIIIIDN